MRKDLYLWSLALWVAVCMSGLPQVLHWSVDHSSTEAPSSSCCHHHCCYVEEPASESQDETPAQTDEEHCAICQALATSRKTTPVVIDAEPVVLPQAEDHTFIVHTIFAQHSPGECFPRGPPA